MRTKTPNYLKFIMIILATIFACLLILGLISLLITGGKEESTTQNQSQTYIEKNLTTFSE